jgi:lantibiotic modifying enzyme
MWHAIMEGALLERSVAALHQICAQVARQYAPVRQPAGGARSGSLDGGAAGFAILFRYLASSMNGERSEVAERVSIAFINRAIELVEEHPMPPSLCGGFAGIAWATEHLQRMNRVAHDDPDSRSQGEEDANGAIDAALGEILSEASALTAPYDLVSGLVGLGVYALERLPRSHAAELLEQIIGHLDARAERTGNEATWWTPRHLLPTFQQRDVSEGYYNLGLAHGVPGVIAFLASALRAGVTTDRTRVLLGESVEWLLKQRQPDSCDSRFPMWTTRTASIPVTTRVAWCYGDLGVAIALLQAARSADEPAWEREAILMARRVATRRGGDAQVVDAGFCHGAAGVGHCFNRLYQATRDSTFADAAAWWLARSLEMWPPGEGYASLKVWDNPTSRWAIKPGFLEGAAGIALALLSATTAIEPSWDRALLLSVPPISISPMTTAERRMASFS